jgi:hypothetical protein
VVQIEDRQGGAEGYTFDLYWGNFAADQYRLTNVVLVGRRLPTIVSTGVALVGRHSTIAARLHDSPRNRPSGSARTP